jgi:ferrochelatase
MKGALVMAYGTPEHGDEIEAYHTDIRRGRPPSPEQLADLRSRYDAIGGLSPLAAVTRAQRDAVAAELGHGWVVELGLKHTVSGPRIEDGAAALVQAGVDVAVGLVLAPHYSALSVGQYHERAAKVFEAALIPYRPVLGWGTERALVDLLAQRVRDARDALGDCANVELVVTAHSLPVRCLDLDDPTYPDQLAATGDAVARRAGAESWRIAWQSAGRTPEPWLGPDILDVLPSLPAGGFDGVVVCPAGFTSDHLEVLYDVDVQARAVAASAGLRLERTASLNDDATFVALLARLVTRHGGA